jgi:F-type H+-transporting ATPase subunit alpha
VDVGISVSRVGGKAQTAGMKKIAGSLRLDLAAFRDLEAFAQLGTELDAATQRQLDRGKRIVELLKQPQYQPYEAFEQVVSIYAGTQGFLDDLPLPRVAEFERGLLAHVRDEFPEILDNMRKTGDLPDAVAAQLKTVIANFKTAFLKK